MKVLRSTLVIGLAAFAAACGDKVNIVQPTPDTTARVNSVTVAPTAVTMSVGQTASFSAAVSVSNGAATTVNWSSSDNAKVTVTSAGVATAKDVTPGVAVCATSTVDATKTGCASVVVSGASAPPAVSIASVTFTNGAGFQQPAAVPPGVVAGQVNVTVNVNPGSSQLDSVVLRINGKTAARQSFSAAASAALRYAAEASPSSQTSTPVIVMSVNTADFRVNSGADTAIVTWPNGTKGFQAFVFGKQGVQGATATNVAASSPVSTYRFGNPNGFFGTMRKPTATATDALGYRWNGHGALTVSAIPVLYDSAQTLLVQSATLTLNTGGACDLGLGGTRSKTVTPTAATRSALTFAFAYDSTGATAAAAGNVNNFELSAAGGCVAAFVSGGDIPSIAALGDNNNNIVLAGTVGTAGAGFLNAPNSVLNPDPNFVVRLDNRPPQGGAAVIAQVPLAAPNSLDPGMNSNNWVGGWYPFSTGFTAPTESGVGQNVAGQAPFPTMYIAGSAPALTGTNAYTAGLPTAIADSSAALTPAANLAKTLQNTNDVFGVRVCDKLGNCRVIAQTAGLSPNTGSTFGVDKAPPVVTAGVTPADFKTFNASPGASLAPVFTDSLSGFGATPAGVVSNLVRVNGTLTGQVATIAIGTGCTGVCQTATFATATAGAFLTATPAAAAYAATPTQIIVTAQTIPANAGYYIYQALARDQAGNPSALFTRRYYVNNSGAPVVTGLNASNAYTGGVAAVFPAPTTDSTQVVSGEFRLRYPNVGAPGYLIYARANPSAQAKWVDGLSMPFSIQFTVPQLIRGIQAVTGGGAPDGATFAAAKPDTAIGRAFNVLGDTTTGANNTPARLAAPTALGVSAEFAAPILNAQIPTGSNYATVSLPTLIATWARVSGGACSATLTATTCVDTLVATGPTGTFLNPFANGLVVTEAVTATTNWRVMTGPGGIAPTGVTVTVGPPLTLDNGVTRTWQWVVTVTRPLGSGTFDYRVIGLNSTFDGLVANAYTRTF